MSEKIQTMRTIAEWLEQDNWKIYYNQKNRENRPTFHANTNSKPDLLATKNNTNILIEAKPGDKHQEILNGYQQTLNYAGEYYIGRANYYKDKEKENQIKIDAVILATKYSQSGFLYNDEQKTNWMKNQYLEKEYNVKEKPATHTITRLLWRQWEKGTPGDYYNTMRINRKGRDIECPQNKPRIGTLISRVNKQAQVTGEPYLLLNNNIFFDMTGRGDKYPFD